MKKLNAFILASVAILTLTLSGCKKNENEIHPIDGGTPAFVGKRMVLSSFIMDPAVDLYGDGKVDDELNEGNAGTWTYNEQTKILRIVDADDKSDISEWKVIEASSKILKAQVEVEEDGFVLKAVMTWKTV